MNVLIAAAHADDEVLGCGGTMAKHVANGDDVYTVIFAEGITSRELKRVEGAHEPQLSSLHDAARQAAVTLGTKPPEFCKLPDNRMDELTLLDVVKIMEDVVARLNPTVIYTHHGGDLNIDHRIVHQSVLTACRPLPGSLVRKIYTFETPSSTEWSDGTSSPHFVPNVFVDIHKTLSQKLEALKCYEQEMRPSPHSRSYEGVEALAYWRGHSAGMKAAEAFMLVRDLDGM